MERGKFKINLDDSAFTKERTPIKPLFQPSSKESQSSQSSAQPATQPTLSYADFIVKNKSSEGASRLPFGPQQKSTSKGSATSGTEEEHSSLKHGCEVPSAPIVLPTSSTELSQETAGVTIVPSGLDDLQDKMTTKEQTPVEGQRSEPGLSLGPKPVGSGNSIIVSVRQKGNPILKFVRSVPWEFGEVVPDYVLGQTTCALFLSLRYHNLNPNYIHDRLKQLGHTFILRVLLIQVDVKDPHHSLKELARICIMADCTLILAWSPEEAGRYLETYKSYENKPADLLKEHVEKDYLSKVTDCLTTIKSVNKTDTITLLSTFSSVEGIINASKEDLVLCPGLGPQKAKRLYNVLHQPFLKSKKIQS